MKKNLLIRIIVTIIFAALLYYFLLPAFNLSNPSFYCYAFIVYVFYLMTGYWKKIDITSFVENLNKYQEYENDYYINNLLF